MEVNPDGPHPVYDLIRRSERAWEEKHAKASRTLRDAVKEYRRRYNRWPPKGFDKWWNYVQENNVQLPDEYDQIFNDISPYLGMHPDTVRKQQTSWEKQSDTYTLVSRGGKIKLDHHTMSKEEEVFVAENRARDQLLLLEPIQEWLPDFRATFTAHDVPYQFIGYSVKADAKEMAAVESYVDTQSMYERYHGWEAACPPDAPIWKYDRKVNLTDLWNQPKTFIWDHKETMNPCNHPSHVRLNGFLDAHGTGPDSGTALIPAFSMCTTQLHADLLTPSFEQYTTDVYGDMDWKDKEDERLLWRGSNTGIMFRPGMNWNISQRVRLVSTTNEFTGYTNVLWSTELPEEPVGEPEKIHKGMLNGALTDIHFAGDPIQCVPEICNRLVNEYEWKERQEFDEAWNYKYIIDVDGNGWSARFKRLITSKSLIFKSTIFPEWYTDRIQPWVHYVPIKNDYTDLYDILHFFRGDFRGQGAHDELAESIALGGRNWSLNYWRNEDMVAYQFRLFLEYARVYGIHREEMDFTLEDVDEVEQQELLDRERDEALDQLRAQRKKAIAVKQRIVPEQEKSWEDDQTGWEEEEKEEQEEKEGEEEEGL
ncbi:Glycosyltransferase Family 90 domain containing protein [Tulasnella sp. 419]|nr:Glycosyltransferase Family 90 domain containing protein [Tulasnella sp. 419]